jgi:hypothetical protein
MRKITDHKINGLNQAIEIEARELSSGGAPTHYRIFIPDSCELKGYVTVHTALTFQSKPIVTPEDYNGITGEALLAVLIDRMRCFQSGPFACRENEKALEHLEEALMWLQKRTRDRMARGVEGSLAK